MKIENNKIVECTEEELYEYWLKNWDDLFDFGTYMRKIKNMGTKIIKKKDKDNGEG